MNFNPNQEEINFVNNALSKFNDENVGPDNHELLNIVEYDENHNVIAGILGGTYRSINLASHFIDEPKKCGAFFLTALRFEPGSNPARQNLS